MKFRVLMALAAMSLHSMPYAQPKSAADGINEYRNLLADGNPAELFEPGNTRSSERSSARLKLPQHRLAPHPDSHGMLNAIDSFTERAVGIVTSGELAKSLDLRNEDPRLLARYGQAASKVSNSAGRATS